MVNTPEYALAKFLDTMIKLYLPQTSMLKSTDHFIMELKEFHSNNQNTMVSFGWFRSSQMSLWSQQLT